MNEDELLKVGREVLALGRTGIHYTKDPYDRERYERLVEIGAELVAAQGDVRSEKVLEWGNADFGYATPKVDTRAFVLQGDEVLLVREDADGGRWTLPGGWADVNETPSENVVREVEEECGYRVWVLRLLAVLDREKQGHEPSYPYHIYKHFFLCEITGGEAKATLESSEARFFPVDDLPELSVARVLPEQLRRFRDMVRDGLRETWFD